MIVRFNIDLAEQDQYDYQVTYEGEDLYSDNGLSSIEACVTAALEVWVARLWRRKSLTKA